MFSNLWRRLFDRPAGRRKNAPPRGAARPKRGGRPTFRPRAEPLEDRLVPTVDYYSLAGVSGTIMFYGDFTSSDTKTYSGDGTQEEPIQLGYAVTDTKDFQPLYFITGSVDYVINDQDPSTQDFKVTGTISSPQFGDIPSQVLWTAKVGSEQTFVVETMLTTGMSLDVPSSPIGLDGFSFTVESIGFSPTDGPVDPNLVTMALRGKVQLGEDSLSLTFAIDGSSYVSIGPTGVDVTGLSVTLNTCFRQFGVAFALSDATVGWNNGTQDTDDEFYVYGSASAYIGVDENNNFDYEKCTVKDQTKDYSFITGNFGELGNPGLVFSDGGVEQLNIGISSSFTVKKLKFTARQATFEYQVDTDTGDPRYEISGEVDVAFNKALSVGVTLGTPEQPGLIIEDGDYELTSFKLTIGILKLGAFTIEDWVIGFSQHDDGTTIGGSLFFVMPRGWGVGAFVTLTDGELEDIGLEYEVVKGGEGIRIPGVGLRLIELKASVQNLLEPSNLVVSGALGVDYGREVSLGNEEVSIFRAQGSATIDKHHLELQGGVYFGALTKTDTSTGLPLKNPDGSFQTKGELGSGTLTMDLNWGSGLYKADVNVSLIDNAVRFQAGFTFDEGESVVIDARASLNVPNGVPLVGGDSILSGNALFEYYVEDDAGQGFLAAWMSVAGEDIGFEYLLGDFDPDDPQFQIIGNSEVQSLLGGEVPGQTYQYPNTIPVPATSANPANPPPFNTSAPGAVTGATSAIFDVTWTGCAGDEFLQLQFPNGSVIPQENFESTGITLLSNLPAPEGKERRAVKVVGSATDPSVALPTGNFIITLITSEKLLENPDFSQVFFYSPAPSVVINSVTPSADGSTLNVSLSGAINSAFAAQTTIDLYADVNPSGHTGVRIADNVPFTVPSGQGAIALTASVDASLAGLFRRDYFLYAVLNDGYHRAVFSDYSDAFTPQPPLWGTVTNYDPVQNLVTGPVGGVNLFLDLNGNFLFDPMTVDADANTAGDGEPIVPTNEDGQYAFWDIPGSPVTVGLLFTDDSVPRSTVFQTVTVPRPVSLDFQVIKDASISGTVFADSNLSGVQDPSEPGLAGWTFNLSGSDGYTSTAVTDNNGYYEFSALSPNTTYTVSYAAPSSFFLHGTETSFTVQTVGDAFQQFMNNDVPAGQYGRVVGFVEGFSIDDGHLDPEASPLANWQITLTGHDYTNLPVSTSTLTDATGKYEFEIVKPGTYQVQQTLPPGYKEVFPTQPQQGFRRMDFGLNTPCCNEDRGLTAFSALVADLDGDSYPDLAFSSNTSQFYGSFIGVFWGKANAPGAPFAFENTAPDAFFAGTPAARDQGQVVAGDVNGDGRLDLVVVGLDQFFAFESDIYVLVNDGGRSFQAGKVWYTQSAGFDGQYARYLTAADINQDGMDDLMVGRTGNGGTLDILQSTGSGFTKADDNENYRGSAIAAGDVDQDGVPDVVYMALDDTLLGIDQHTKVTIDYGEIDGKGDIKLDRQQIYYGYDDKIPVGPVGLADIDGNGHLDPIFESGTGGEDASIGYYLNSGCLSDFLSDNDPGTAVNANPLPALDQVNLMVGDFNGDGKPDLAGLSNSEGPWTVTIYLNQGAAPYYSSAAPITLSIDDAVGYPGLTSAGDLNADGLTDLIISDQRGARVIVLFSELTNPAPSSLTLTDGQTAVQNFVNVQFGDISGSVAEDVNFNGAFEPGEQGVPGVQVYLDLSDNGIYDEGFDPVTTTGARGGYAFAGLPTGTYQVRVVMPDAAHRPTTSGGDHLQAVVPSRTPGAELNFGVGPRLLESVPHQTVREGEELRFTVRPTAAGARHALLYEIENAPAGLRLNPGTGEVTFTPAFDQGPGTYSATVRVRDPFNPLFREELPLSLTVEDNPNAPAPVSSPPGRVLEGVTLPPVIGAADGAHSGLDAPTPQSPGVVQVGLGSYSTNFPDRETYPEYTSPVTKDYHPPSTVFLSGAATSPSLVFPYVTPGSPFIGDGKKPVQTSDWWSSLLFRRDIDRDHPFHVMQPHPLSLLPRADGLGMAYVSSPTIVAVPDGDPRGPGTQYFQYQYPQTAPGSGVYQDDVTVGLAALTNTDPDRVTVYDYSDWTVTADWDGQMRATAGHGLPFVYYQFPLGGDAQVRFSAGQPATLIQNFNNGAVLVQVGSRYYGLFGPTSAAGSWDTSDNLQYTLTGLTPQTGYLSVAVLPDGFDPATDIGTTFELFRSHAYNFVTGSQVTYTYDESTGQLLTTYQLTTQFQDNTADATLNQTEALQALYVHQWEYLFDGEASPTLTYASPRGQMKLLTNNAVANTFQTSLRYAGTLPFLPDIPDGAAQANYHSYLWSNELLPYLKLRSTAGLPEDRLDLSNLIRGGDVYSLGQSLLGAAQLVPLLYQVSQTLSASTDTNTQQQGELAAQYAEAVFNRVKDEMGAWLSVTDDRKVQYLYYDQNFDALLATPGAYFSSDSVNDQHLGFGYYIKTAALIAQYDPQWAALDKMGGMIELLIQEVANPVTDPNGQLLPRLRNFDPYAGHSWADGAANSDNGNNQESSSEGLNFASGLIQWGLATGDDDLRDLGVYLFTTESTSINYYYFNQQNALNPAAHAGVTRPAIAILESIGGEYQTFFGTTPAIVASIQFLPFTGGSYYLADLGRFQDADGNPVYDATYNETNFQAGNGGENPLRVYQNPLYMYRALQGQAQASAALDYLFDPATGNPNYLPFDGAPGTPYSGNNGIDNPPSNYHWLSVLRAFGQPDRTVTADTAAYAVFVADDNVTRTYAAYNPTASTLRVLFSDGYVLNVPARSLKTAAGLASDSPAAAGMVTDTPDYSLKTPPNRLFLLGGDPDTPSQGKVLIGRTGAYEANARILAANNGAVTDAGLQARTPPNAQAITFTLTGVTGNFDRSYDPSEPFHFSIWLDGGVIPEEVLSSQVGLLIEIFNNGGSGVTPDYYVRYAEYALPLSSAGGVITGYLNPYTEDVGGGIVDYSGQSSDQPLRAPPTLDNATITVTLFTSLGLTPVNLRLNAAAEQGRVSYIDIPYEVTASAPGITVHADRTSTTAGEAVTLTATVTAVGNTLPDVPVQFYGNGQPIGSPQPLGTPATQGGLTVATATLAGFTGLPAGPVSVTAEIASPPAITGLSVAGGGAGQVVRISGQMLSGATAVTFGGVPAASFTVDSPTQITATVSAGGSGPVQVTTPQGVATSATPFTYATTPAPILTDYTPASAGQGAQVTLTGSHFTGATQVTVGGAAVSRLTVDSDTQITIILGSAGSGPIEVTTPGGVASSAYLSDPARRGFLFGGVGPTITGLSTLSGTPDTVFTITGQLFGAVTCVTIGGVPVPYFSVDTQTDNSITVRTGAVATGPVAVSSAFGQSTSVDIFSFSLTPALSLLSPPVLVTVNQAAKATPSVTVASSAPNVPYGSAAARPTFTASVTGAGGRPTGAVTFRVNGEALATVGLDADGQATYTPDKPLLPGTYALTADYEGDTAYAAATSTPVTQVVARIQPTVQFIDAVANPAIGGPANLVLLRAILTSTDPSVGYAPTGVVNFYDGDTLLGQGGATFEPGIYTFTTVFDPDPTDPTTHTIRVQFLGDSYYEPLPNPPATLTLIIEPATQTQGLATTTTVRSSVGAEAPEVNVNQRIYFNADVAVANPPAGFTGYVTGQVTLEYTSPSDPTWRPMDVNPEFLLLYYTGEPNLDQTILDNLPNFVPTETGTYGIRARFQSQIDFAGNPNPQFQDSTSPTFLLEVVSQAGLYPTAIAVTASQAVGLPAGTTLLDQGVTFTATITSPNSWGSGPFGDRITGESGSLGNVQFYQDGAPFGGLIPVEPDGTARLTVSSLPPGQAHQWTAQFLHQAGTTVFADTPVSSPPVPHSVVTSDPTKLSVVVTPSANPSPANSPATLTVKVTGQSPRNLGVPGGQVQVKVLQGSTDFGGFVTLDGSGQAVFTTPALAAGSYTVSAVYNADGSDLYFPTAQPQNTSTPFTLTVGTPQVVGPQTPVAYVDSLYARLLGRAPDSSSGGWVKSLEAGASRFQVAQGIWNSAEHRGVQVDSFYATYLHRAADPAGRAYWISQLLAGMTETQVVVGFLTSAEYLASHADIGSYIASLYNDVLQRAADDPGLRYWLEAAQQGASRAALAGAFATSNEAYLGLTNRDYRDFLGRTAQSSEAAYWAGLLGSGAQTPASLGQLILSSDEFYARG